jgi:membrane-associated protease RseP (regulator of RpoE activity)
MHFLIAIVLLFGVYATQGEITARDEPRVLVAATSDGLPAAGAGIRADDEIVSVGGIAVTSASELGAAVRSVPPGDAVDVVVLRDGTEITSSVELVANTSVPVGDERYGTALIGIRSYSPPLYEDHGIGGAAVNSVTDVFPVSWASIQGVVKVLNPVNIVSHLTGTNDDIESRPTTIYGVANVSDEVGNTSGLAGVLYLLAVLNVFVGVFNMFPLLPLDGGHAAHSIRDNKLGILRPAIGAFRQANFFLPERFSVRRAGVLFIGGAIGDVAIDDDQGGAVCGLLKCRQRALQHVEVVGITHPRHVPTISDKPGRDVITVG